MQGPSASLVDFHLGELYPSSYLNEGGQSVAKTVKPGEGAEQFSRDRLLGWFFRRLDVPRWGQLFFYIFSLSAIGLLSLGGIAFRHLSGSANDANSRIEEARRHLGGRIEQSESRLSTRIDSVISQLAQELIKRAKSDVASGKLTEAGKEIAVASSLISLSHRNRLKAPPAFFTEVVLGLDAIASIPKARLTFVPDLRQIRFQLAEYRSALETTPELPKKSLAAAATIEIPPPPASYTVLKWTGPPGADVIRTTSRSPEGHRVVNLSILGGSQTLDWINWEGVAFVNCHIKYLGGRLSLQNVVFVNCTFEIVENDRGAQVADYIALRRSVVLIEPESGKRPA